MPRLYEEKGRIGQRRYSGVFYEEFVQELKGKRGIEVYREMADNDAMIGAVLYSIKSLVKQATWQVQPVSDKPEDIECAEFLESCLYDMQDTWTDTLSEIISFITYGWSYHEIVYKRRMGRTGRPETDSEYNDGLIGLRKLPIRAQDTLFQWEYDEEDNLLGMTQLPPPDFVLRTIPIEKAVLFRTESRKGNPEGRSILRNSYQSWYFKKRIQEIEGIGIERDLSGLPVLHAPTFCDIWSDENAALLDKAQKMADSIRADTVTGIVLPGAPAQDADGWKIELLSSGGRKAIDTNAIIERYDSRIAMSMMADFILLGHQQVGSFALSSDKTELFSVALGSYLDIIAESITKQVFSHLIELNEDHFKGITEIPDLTHGDIENADLDKLSAFVERMVKAGTITPDADLEDFLRETAGLPAKVEDEQADDGQFIPNNPNSPNEPDDMNNRDDNQRRSKTNRNSRNSQGKRSNAAEKDEVDNLPDSEQKAFRGRNKSKPDDTRLN